MLTRFVASDGPPRDPIADDPKTIEDVRCLVRLRTSRGFRDLIIATELGGGIRVFDDRAALAPRARTQLAFHEVASGRVLELHADELFIFDLQTIEMLPDAPGLNDALYLYGALRGPYPDRIGTPTASIDGQLTVTRADLLAGLIDGVVNAFAYAPDAHGARCVHALLPGERADVIAGGRGVVLALPLVPGWLLDCPVPNDLVAAQILHDVLSALRRDLGAPADTPLLPVPSRPALEKRLIAEGWRIEGDEAVRPKGRGVLGALQGSERRRLPPQGTLDELVAEAKALLARMPDLPTAEMASLHRISRGTGSAPVSAPTQTHVPSAQQAPTPSASAHAPRPRVAAASTDWMKDFVDAHRSPARPAPRVSTPARSVAPGASPKWMGDFDEAEEAGTPEPSVESKPKQDWSKDFD